MHAKAIYGFYNANYPIVLFKWLHISMCPITLFDVIV